MSAQLSFVAARDPEAIARQAIEEHRPVARFALFSGGNDSAATLHYLWTRGLCDEAVHIDTGIGIPATRTFVHEFCEQYRIPLRVLTPPEKTYEEMVLTDGFPGPGAHLYAYTNLKERALDKLVRETKTKRSDRVAFLTGVRLAESRRRMGHVVPIERDGAQLWVAPLIDWTKDDLRAYRAEHGVPESEVAALLHMSGECLCGAFAQPGEIKDIETFYGETAAYIHDLERRAADAGVQCATWGVPCGRRGTARSGRLCGGCETRQLHLLGVAA